MIKSFRDKEARLIWQGEVSSKLPLSIQQVARRKLRMLNSAQSLNDLRVPPANRLEALKGGRQGQHAVRINRQWRICFRWIDGHAHAVSIVDYHS